MRLPSVHAWRAPSAAPFRILLPLLLLAACAPGELKEGLAPNDAEVVAVVVTPEKTAVVVAETIAVRASAVGLDGQPAPAEVDWTASGGTIVALNDSTARFSAGSAGTYRVRGRHRRTPNPIDSTTIIVAPLPPVLQAVVLTPATASVAAGAQQQFSVAGQWSDGSTTAPAVSYAATGGTVNANGRYTAGTTAGTFRVIATQQGGSLADTSTVTVTVTPPVLQAVVLTPATASVAAGAQQQFSVAGQWSDGSTTAPAVSYAATGGTVNANGRYTAGTTAGTFRVIATQQGGSLADTSTVTVTVTPPVLQAVVLTPATASVAAGAQQQFSVAGQWSDGSTTAPAVSYAATGGTVNANGRYTAGTTAGTFRVIATQQGGSLADTSTVTVTVTPPVLQAVVLTPATASVAAGAQQQFSVAGQWSDGSTTAPAVTYAATGGTVNTSGRYTAGTTAGTFRVIATQQGGHPGGHQHGDRDGDPAGAAGGGADAGDGVGGGGGPAAIQRGGAVERRVDDGAGGDLRGDGRDGQYQRPLHRRDDGGDLPGDRDPAGGQPGGHQHGDRDGTGGWGQRVCCAAGGLDLVRRFRAEPDVELLRVRE